MSDSDALVPRENEGLIDSPLTSVPTPTPSSPVFPPWTWLDMLLLTLAVVACLAVFSFVGGGIAMLLPAFKGQKITEIARSTKLNVSIQGFSYLVILVIMNRLVRHHGTGLLKGIRWNWPGQMAILYPALGIAIAIGIQAMTKGLDRYIPSNLPIEKMFRTPSDAWFLVVFGLTLAPLLEEFFFRGFLYPTIAKYAGVVIATIVTMLSFVAIHAAQLASAWVPLLMLTVASFLFTLIRIKSDSVAAAVLTHVGYNGTLFVAMFLVTGGFRHLEKLAQ